MQGKGTQYKTYYIQSILAMYNLIQTDVKIVTSLHEPPFTGCQIDILKKWENWSSFNGES